MKGRDTDIDILSSDGAQESPPIRLPARQPGSTDPVAAHFEDWGVHMCDAEHLAAPGYVLVNAEGLAAALRLVFAHLSLSDRKARKYAAAILATIQEQTDE